MQVNPEGYAEITFQGVEFNPGEITSVNLEFSRNVFEKCIKVNTLIRCTVSTGDGEQVIETKLTLTTDDDLPLQTAKTLSLCYKPEKGQRILTVADTVVQLYAADTTQCRLGTSCRLKITGMKHGGFTLSCAAKS